MACICLQSLLAGGKQQDICVLGREWAGLPWPPSWCAVIKFTRRGPVLGALSLPAVTGCGIVWGVISLPA